MNRNPKMQTESLNATFEKINSNTNFKTMVVSYGINTIKNIEITYKDENSYTIYDLDVDLLYNCNYNQIVEEMSKIKFIFSITLQSITCDLNFYNYPEIIQIKVY